MTSAYPLIWPEGWKRTPDYQRKSGAPFRTTFDRARRELMDELRRLGAKNVVISSHLAIRNDGMPYADQARRRIPDPGVAVYFMLRGKQMVLARDAYGSVHDNLRSVGLAIEHLRGLERHGGATMMERAFEGFASIAAPGAAKGWREVLGIPPNVGVTLAFIESQYRDRAKRCHPDAGGSDEQMAELNWAREEARKGLA